MNVSDYSNVLVEGFVEMLHAEGFYEPTLQEIQTFYKDATGQIIRLPLDMHVNVACKVEEPKPIIPIVLDAT